MCVWGGGGGGAENGCVVERFQCILQVNGFTFKGGNFQKLILPLEKESMQKCKTLLSFITKTYLYNFNPLKPHFYIVKRVYRGVHYFLISAQNIDCRYSLEPPLRRF